MIIMPTRAKRNKRLYLPKVEKNYVREQSASEYHTNRWKRESKVFRQRFPLCEECRRNGKLVPAEVVDHIIPFPVCPDFFNPSNWQSLCKKCNIAKGNRDKKLIQEYKQNHQ